MRLRLRTLRHITIPHRTILPAAAMTVPARTMAEAVTVEMIAAETAGATAVEAAVGDAVADVIVADAPRAAPAVAICLPPNTHRPRVATRADMIIAVAPHAAPTIAVRQLRVARRPPSPMSPTHTSSFRVNLWQN